MELNQSQIKSEERLAEAQKTLKTELAEAQKTLKTELAEAQKTLKTDLLAAQNKSEDRLVASQFSYKKELSTLLSFYSWKILGMFCGALVVAVPLALQAFSYLGFEIHYFPRPKKSEP